MDSYRHSSMRPEDEIPVLDMGPYLAGVPGSLDVIAKQLLDAATRVGFYYVKNHGIPQAMIDQAFVESARFHGLLIEAKRKLGIDKHKIGYQERETHTMLLSPKMGQTKTPDLFAALCLRHDIAPDHPDVLAGKPYRGPNHWPENLPGFRENIVAYMDAVENVAHSLLPVIGRALGVPDDFFEAPFAHPLINFQLNHYPDQPDFDGKQFGIAPHTDRSFITILCQAKVPGLEIQMADGRWVVAPVLPGHLLVNTGDLLRCWSNDAFRSTPHRVINVSRGERHSIPFFYKPDLDVPIVCIPSCQSADNPPKYPPTTVLDFYNAFVKANFHVVAEVQAKAETA